MESLDTRISERVLEKVKSQMLLQGRVFISIDFISRCNHILVFRTTFSFNGRKPSQEQFNFDLFEEKYEYKPFMHVPGMIY